MKEEEPEIVAEQKSGEEAAPSGVNRSVRMANMTEDLKKQEGSIMKSLRSLMFFGAVLVLLYWMNQQGLLGFLNNIGEKLQVEKSQLEESQGAEGELSEFEPLVDMPEVLGPYLIEVQKGMERWRLEADLEDEVRIQRLRHSDDFQKLLVEYERVGGAGLSYQTMVLERDEFARFVYFDRENNVQVVVYSPANQRAVQGGELRDENANSD